MTEPCPCCGQALPHISRLTVDPITGVAIRNGKSARLEPRSAQLVRALLLAKLKPLNEGELRAALGLKASISVRTLIHKARVTLRPLGADIVVMRGRGYRLTGASA